MSPRKLEALMGWLEYSKPATWRWWIEGGYTLNRRGDVW